MKRSMIVSTLLLMLCISFVFTGCGKNTGVTYTNLLTWDGVNDMLPSVATPTTYFVDSNGKLIGDPIMGANPAKYKEKMEEYLSKAE